MEEEISLIIEMAKEQMQKASDHLKVEFSNIRAGKASPNMLGGVRVDYYGSQTPLAQVANVSTPDARTITVQPFEKSLIQEIERGIMFANLGLNPMNNGDMVIINVPVPTQERRRELVKQAKAEVENAKISIRNARKDANSEIKKLDISDDMKKNHEATVQTMTDEFSKQTDANFTRKEADILKV
ncbi:MAG: ribosome recycling factor [Flavobacteriaceae bacterium]|nr:ribosome recycling factor [Flavobacteriaceae bacterium]